MKHLKLNISVFQYNQWALEARIPSGSISLSSINFYNFLFSAVRLCGILEILLLNC